MFFLRARVCVFVDKKVYHGACSQIKLTARSKLESHAPTETPQKAFGAASLSWELGKGWQAFAAKATGCTKRQDVISANAEVRQLVATATEQRERERDRTLSNVVISESESSESDVHRDQPTKPGTRR